MRRSAGGRDNLMWADRGTARLGHRRQGFLSPLWGLTIISAPYPRLAPWAAFFRRFAASGAGACGLCFERVRRITSRTYCRGESLADCGSLSAALKRCATQIPPDTGELSLARTAEGGCPYMVSFATRIFLLLLARGVGDWLRLGWGVEVLADGVAGEDQLYATVLLAALGRVVTRDR
jgi:hypothetical protein